MSTSESSVSPETNGNAVVSQTRTFPCEGCGSALTFSIEDQSLACPQCGFVKEIAFEADENEDATPTNLREQDLLQTLKRLQEHNPETVIQEREQTCAGCGATVLFEGNLTSTHCGFCGTPWVNTAASKASLSRVQVDGVLPFAVSATEAARHLRKWVARLWFAPSTFKKRGTRGEFNGVYLPFWTFDAMSYTVYVGQRGENYTVTVGSGENRRTETRVRWHPASGSFSRFFDDFTISASTTPDADILESLEPWPFENVKPYNGALLAGFEARAYDVPLDAGFTRAKLQMDHIVREQVRQRIGGDRQRIHSVDTRLSALKYKHLLLPAWLMAYRYGEKTYQVVVNACTGEVQGTRPYSWVKIGAAAIVGLSAISCAIYLVYT